MQYLTDTLPNPAQQTLIVFLLITFGSPSPPVLPKSKSTLLRALSKYLQAISENSYQNQSQ